MEDPTSGGKAANGEAQFKGSLNVFARVEPRASALSHVYVYVNVNVNVYVYVYVYVYVCVHVYLYMYMFMYLAS